MPGLVTVLCGLISLIGMLLLAWKWNIPYRSIVPGAVTLAVAFCPPFLSVHRTDGALWHLCAGALCQIGCTLAVALAIILFRFWRDPERRPPQGDGLIVSPADGHVIFVRSISAGTTPVVVKDGRSHSLPELVGIELIDCKMSMISIEMNILNVHVNRCPIQGTVKVVKPIPGQFLSLRNREAPFTNARCTTLIANDSLKLATVQIASRLVRRVDSYLQPGQIVTLGQRLGMIRFGSQVTMIFPEREDIKLEVRAGEAVTAGISVIARYCEWP